MSIQSQENGRAVRRPQRPPRVANYQQRRKIEELMLTNSEETADQSHRVWHPGWSFKRAAQEVSKIFDAGHAHRIAQSLNLRFLPTQVPATAVLAQLAELVQRVERCELALHLRDSRTMGRRA